MTSIPFAMTLSDLLSFTYGSIWECDFLDGCVALFWLT